MAKYDIEKVRQFIVDTFLFGDGDELKSDTSFLESGIIDSTGILEVISFLEREFSVTVDDTELLPENLDSLENIGRFLEKKQSGE